MCEQYEEEEAIIKERLSLMDKKFTIDLKAEQKVFLQDQLELETDQIQKILTERIDCAKAEI